MRFSLWLIAGTLVVSATGSYWFSTHCRHNPDCPLARTARYLNPWSQGETIVCEHPTPDPMQQREIACLASQVFDPISADLTGQVKELHAITSLGTSSARAPCLPGATDEFSPPQLLEVGLHVPNVGLSTRIAEQLSVMPVEHEMLDVLPRAVSND